MRASSSQHKPDPETQVRPLVGLPLEQAEAAWQHAAQKAGDRKITAALVKRAVRELGFVGQPSAEAKGPSRQTKTQLRRLIDGAMGELLVLLSQKASHDSLTAKVEALHGHFQRLFTKVS